MLRPLLIALLEGKRFLADRGELAFGIALPIVLFALMYAAFGGDQTFSGTAHVVDQDGGPAAEELVERLESVEGLDVQRYSWEEADEALQRSRVFSVAVIPEGFSAGLAGGNAVAITFRQRGSGGDEGQIVASIVQGIARDLASEYQVRHAVHAAVAGGGLSPAEVDAIVDRHLAQARTSPPVTVTTRDLGESADLINLFMPGLLTMFMLFSVTIPAQSIVTERQNGTLERLLTTRLGVNELFAGKLLGGVARAMFQALLLLSLSFLVLQLGGFATYLFMLLFAVLFAGAVSAIGMLIAALARSRDQGTWMAVFFTLLMAVFGGTFFQAAGPMDTISRFTVNRYANDAFRAILLDGTSASVAVEAAILVAILTAALVLARLAFRVTEGGR